jgi:hypothetical protein
MKSRSLFGPLLLIAVGVVWLLVSLSVIPSSNLWALPRLAPYLLMGFGLALLVRSRWLLAGSMISSLVVVGAVAAIIFAGQLGWDQPGSWTMFNGLPGSVSGSGTIKTETRQLESFNTIALEYPAEVTIQQGDVEALEIKADDNLLPQIKTDVISGRLTVRNAETNWNARVEPSRTVEINITVKDIREIIFSAAGDLQVNGLKGDTLKVVLSGAGQIKLGGLELKGLDTVLSGAGDIQADGTADELDVIISGFGDFKGAELTSRTATIRISGAGDATARVKQQLDATITGAGSVNYYGTPQIEQQISGAGSVRQAGD